jgi:hypothetical protein
VDGELGGIERPAFAQILSRSNYLIPRFERHILYDSPPLEPEALFPS